MGWGDALSSAWDSATETAKAAGQAVSNSAAYAYDAVKRGAVAAKDAVVGGAIAAKDAAVAGARATRDAVVAGANAGADAVEYAADQGKLAVIRAREAQARAAFGTGYEELGENEAGCATEACPHAIAKCAELKDALNKAILANDTYTTDASPEHIENVRQQTGYKRLDPNNPEDREALKRLLDTDNPDLVLSPGDSDFRAMVYEKPLSSGQTEYVVGFRGTQTGNDWKQNLAQGSGFESDSYNRAKELSRSISTVSKHEGNPVSFTGHSLGGGLASAAAVQTGNPANTYNAAGLNANTVPSPLPAPVDAYFTPTDPLSALQDNRGAVLGGATAGAGKVPVVGPLLQAGLGAWIGANEVKGTPVLPPAYGNRRLVPFPEGREPPDLSFGGVLEAHGMDLLIDSLEAQRKALGCQ